MATRSPHNDRYKTDLKGKTKKSASSAKPKRVVADVTPASTAKKPAAKKKSRWGVAPAANPVPAFTPSPEMKKLRRYWWILWGMSLLIAVVILLMNKAGATYQGYVPFAWGLWAASMGGAFYLEFTPIRKARMAAIEAARSGGSKKHKNDAAKAEAAKVEAGKAETSTADTTSESEDK